MTTAGAIINRVSRQLLSGTVEERNKLATTLSDTTGGTVVMTYDLKGLQTGTIFEIGSELMYVWADNSSTKTLTVERGYLGTTAATHTAGDLVTINPRFPIQQMLDGLNQEIDDLSSPMNGLYQVVSVNLTSNTASRQIDITGSTKVINLLEVRYRYLATDHLWLRNVRVERDLPTTDFASGNALTFDEPISSGTVRVTYSAPFVRATATTTDLQTTCLVPVSMEDILELGLMVRMVSVREIKRNFIESQGDTRRSEEVLAGAVANSIVDMRRLRNSRIAAEAARLQLNHPTILRS